MNGGRTFPAETLDALFQAVEVNDVVDPVVSLPNPIPIACSEEEMRRCLDLCMQFWSENADPVQMRALAHTLIVSGDLPPDARVRYKNIRAAYKQLRFALVLHGKRHKAPRLFRWTVAVMGHLQDAFRNRRRMAVLGYGLMLRLMLSRPLWMAVRREVETVELDTSAGFLAFRREEFHRLKRWLESGSLSGHQFHMMRKVVSRQVSFYDVMRTLQPDEQVYRMSRFLSAINGLMGGMHDDLVEQAGAGQRNYHRDSVAIPGDLADRLRTLVARNPFVAA
ncbi:hypothetical protein EDF56_102517 [Novosphingobium sp. PhB165]|uniref:hypothetical protein n=1 Tax=Novosphingobium sp. PhB165 TaxID=2485105 RepID=UPI001045F59A|nr:hypothetical protein [Novosphingobium sp. PhB165]TCM20854.1 hypothetical protein EDF56_102517 [Novosphingobium sp. PhB165]